MENPKLYRVCVCVYVCVMMGLGSILHNNKVKQLANNVAPFQCKTMKLTCSTAVSATIKANLLLINE